MRRKAVEGISRYVLLALSQSSPLTRNELQDGLVALTWTLGWTPDTCSRQLRLAFNELERQGYPVISDGHGFRLATTPEERSKAAKKLEKMGLSLLKRASIIRGLTLDGEMKQLSLEDV